MESNRFADMMLVKSENFDWNTSTTSIESHETQSNPVESEDIEPSPIEFLEIESNSVDSEEMEPNLAESEEIEPNSKETEPNLIESEETELIDSEQIELKEVESSPVEIESESNEIKPNIVVQNSIDETIEKVVRGYVGKQKIISRNKVCSTVPLDHFGPIPGIPVGSCWLKRYQASEAGVHRPLVAGIHGREKEGAYSIVLSGTYAEDKDFGEEFYYSGCGGGVTDPSKLTSAQIRDQTLTRYNKALAMSCNAPLNDQFGADAEDWRAGKPVRVIRNHKLKKHSIYAPNEGNRYDGIYKVVKYFPKIGESGLLVWRYLLRRDDPEPAPWTEEGKRLIEENKLELIVPDETHKAEKISKPTNDIKVKRVRRKRSLKLSGSQFPCMEPSKKIIQESEADSLAATNNIQGEGIDAKPDLNLLETNLLPETPKKRKRRPKLNKLNAQVAATKRNCKPKSSKSCAGFSQKQLYADNQFSDWETCQKAFIKSEMGTSTPNLSSDHNYTQDETYLDFQFPDLETWQRMIVGSEVDLITPTSNPMSESDYLRGETVETEPDISFLLKNSVSEPSGKRSRKSKPRKYQRAGLHQPAEAIPKLSITVSSGKSVKDAVGCKTPSIRNKKNSGRNRVTGTTEPLKTQNQIDLISTKKEDPYELTDKVEKFIECDTLNKTIWDYCRKNFLHSKTEFLNIVKLMFTCRYCCRILESPVTTPCNHNICLECISNHFSEEKYSCPECQHFLGSSFRIKENENLTSALENLFRDSN